MSQSKLMKLCELSNQAPCVSVIVKIVNRHVYTRKGKLLEMIISDGDDYSRIICTKEGNIDFLNGLEDGVVYELKDVLCSPTPEAFQRSYFVPYELKILEFHTTIDQKDVEIDAGLLAGVPIGDLLKCGDERVTFEGKVLEVQDVEHPNNKRLQKVIVGGLDHLKIPVCLWGDKIEKWIGELTVNSVVTIKEATVQVYQNREVKIYAFRIVSPVKNPSNDYEHVTSLSCEFVSPQNLSKKRSSEASKNLTIESLDSLSNYQVGIVTACATDIAMSTVSYCSEEGCELGTWAINGVYTCSVHKAVNKKLEPVSTITINDDVKLRLGFNAMKDLFDKRHVPFKDSDEDSLDSLRESLSDLLVGKAVSYTVTPKRDAFTNYDIVRISATPAKDMKCPKPKRAKKPTLKLQE